MRQERETLEIDIGSGSRGFRIDVMLAKRKMSVTVLSEKVGITLANISVLKNVKAKAIKIETLNRICKVSNYFYNRKRVMVKRFCNTTA